jgi:hypothetical protein
MTPSMYLSNSFVVVHVPVLRMLPMLAHIHLKPHSHLPRNSRNQTQTQQTHTPQQPQKHDESKATTREPSNIGNEPSTSQDPNTCNHLLFITCQTWLSNAHKDAVFCSFPNCKTGPRMKCVLLTVCAASGVRQMRPRHGDFHSQLGCVHASISFGCTYIDTFIYGKDLDHQYPSNWFKLHEPKRGEACKAEICYHASNNLSLYHFPGLPIVGLPAQ